MARLIAARRTAVVPRNGAFARMGIEDLAAPVLRACLADAGIAPAASIIDVGGGASTLVDDLLDARFTELSVLDLSGAALATARDRLGERAQQVCWLEADILQARFARHAYDVWHDRATFHFLTEKTQVERYLDTAQNAVSRYLVVGTFSDTGPRKCSGLDIKQYSEADLEAAFEKVFQKIRCVNEDHETPFQTVQNFTFCSFTNLKYDEK